ncbi:MAG: hypothetical protein Q9160_003898 [Pyrenula sp. 1 TL-2023]
MSCYKKNQSKSHESAADAIKEIELKLEAIHRAVGEGQAASRVSQQLCVESSHVEQEGRLTPAASKEQAQASPGTAPASNETPSKATVSKSSNETLGDIFSGTLVSHALANDLYCSFFTSLAPLYPLVLVPNPSIWPIPICAYGGNNGNGSSVLQRQILSSPSKADIFHAIRAFGRDMQDVSGLLFPLLQVSAPGTSRDHSEIDDNNSMASSLRRPTMLPYGPWVDDCINVLESQTFMHLNDRRLIAWTHLQRLAEESFAVAGLDQRSSIDLSDTRTRFVLQGCVERVTNWRQTISEGLMNGAMRNDKHPFAQNLEANDIVETMEMHYQMVLINLHEPALHVFHDLTDFRPPYTIRSATLTRTASSGPLSLEIASGLTQCMSSAEALLCSFLSMPNSTLLSVPIVTYTRIAYAIVVLIKSYISTHTSANTLKVDQMRENERSNPTKLLPRVLEKLDTVAGHARFPVPMVFYRALSKVHDWFQKQFNPHLSPGRDHDTLIEPMMHMNLESTRDNDDAIEEKLRSSVSALQGAEDTHAPVEQSYHPATSLTWQDDLTNNLESNAFDGGSFLDLPPALWNIDFDDPDLKAALGI